MMKLSIIIPAYNVEKYIDICLESITKQDLPYSDYEIIIINDGSTDSTLRHIQEYTIKFSNLVIINQTNQGQSVARNIGVQVAHGEYIWFIDADDYICSNCISNLLKICDHLQTDMFCVAPSIPFVDFMPNDFLINKTYLLNIYDGKNWVKERQDILVPWGYIIRRAFWLEHHFEFIPGISYEDAECMSRSLYYAKRISGLAKFSVYNYVQRDTSIMHSPFNWEKVQSFPILIKSLNTFIKQVVNDPFFVSYYKEICIGAYINGLKQFAINKSLRKYFKEYIKLVKNAGGVQNTKTSIPIIQRIYRFIAIYFPYLFVKICK